MFTPFPLSSKLCAIFFSGLALILVWINPTYASGPGDLDTTFGGTGIVTTSVSSGADGGFAATIQPDGKVVVVGTSNGEADFAVLRYNSDGNLDSTFNDTGIVTTSIGNGYEAGQGVVLQADQKILVVGTGASSGSGTNFVVLRYNPNGSLDAELNGTGVVTTRIGDSFDVGRAVGLQSDGKIIVAGDTIGGWPVGSDFAVVRYNPNGSLDTSWKGTGIVTTSVSSSDRGQAVLIQADGKIIVAGSSTSQFAVLRYTTTGDLDGEFNGTGVVTTSVGTSSGGTSAALQADGKIIVVGSTGIGANSDFAVVRHTSDGSLDPAFNSTGIVTTDISSGFDIAQGVTIQPNDKIVVVGVSNFNLNTGNLAVVRYNSDGSLDTTFGSGGIITTTVSSNRDEAQAVALQTDGKIVVVGFENATGTVNDNINFVVARYIGDTITYLPIIFKE